LNLIRANSTHPDFIAMVSLLDKELAIRDGDDHAFYAQFNKVDTIRHVVVAYKDDIPVACGAIKPYDDHTMEVKRMYTLESHRGLGIASMILSALEAWAAELGFRRCILETGLNQPEALALYPKNGYTRIPNYGQYEGVENSVCFEKKLVSFAS
jgi:putative acetyltransferase